jgi:hypothetical protein
MGFQDSGTRRAAIKLVRVRITGKSFVAIRLQHTAEAIQTTAPTRQRQVPASVLEAG